MSDPVDCSASDSAILTCSSSSIFLMVATLQVLGRLAITANCCSMMNFSKGSGIRLVRLRPLMILISNFNSDIIIMQQFRTNVQLAFELKGAARVKAYAVHPSYSWVGLVTVNNVFWLCDYEKNLTLNCFNCSTFEDRPTQIRQLLFWDKHTLKPLMSGRQQKQPKTWIVFSSNIKVFFYDYVTYITKIIIEKDLDFKTIRKIQVVSEDTLCISVADGLLKIFDVQQWTVTKTIKGYYSKIVSWVIPCKQNENERPRIIAASTDNMMACWNVDVAGSVIETPSFKFMTRYKNKDSSEGQEILAMRYDPFNFRIITLTEEYIALWNTLSGTEIQRFRNVSGMRDIDIFNHIDYPLDTFVGHCRGEEVVIACVNTNAKQNPNIIPPLQAVVMFSQRDANSPDSRIIKIQTLPEVPWLIFVSTASGFVVFEVNKLFQSSICTHPSFSTRLSIANCREFYGNDGSLNGPVTPYKLQNMQYRGDDYYNFFFLSSDKGIIYLNLLETRLTDTRIQRRLFKLYDLASNPLFKDKIQTSVSPETREITFWSESSMYFEVYSIVGISSELIELEDSSRLDFYSKLELKLSGLCTAIAWHLYKSELAVISPVNQTGGLVKYKSAKFDVDSKIIGYQLCLYSNTPKGFELFFRKDIQTNLHTLFGGPYFSYAVFDKTETAQPGQAQQPQCQLIELVETQQTTVKILSPHIFAPQKMYWDYAGQICIIVYNTEFSVYKVDGKGSLIFMDIVSHDLIEGYFWQKIFFFFTGKSLFAMTILPDIVVIELAAKNIKDTGFRLQFDIFQPDYVDSLEGIVLQLPSGQLKFLSIVNMCIYFIDNHNQVIVLPIANPYLRFCIEVVTGCVETAGKIYENVDPQLLSYFDDVLKVYGWTPAQLRG